jgi:hypothetical protein
VLKRACVVLAIILVSAPALTQGEKTFATPDSACADGFKSADKNTDGVLTQSEFSGAQNLSPELKKGGLVSRNEFLAACAKTSQTAKFDKPAAPSPHSTGQTVSPDTKGQKQPQGETGPLNTKDHGAPAESPQGQTPPGMQAAPGGSSKTIIDPEVKRQ